MREAFARQLAGVEHGIHDELGRAAVMLAIVADAITDSTAEKAQAIAEHGRRLWEASHSLDAELVTITARQTPVAGDLRLVLALIQLAHHEGLIANQFELISEQLMEIDPAVLDRQRTREKLSLMTRLAGSQLQSAAAAFAARDLNMAQQVDRDDDAIDKLNREIFEATLELDDAPEERELALRHVLIARSLERVGDNAVDIAEQAAFLVTTQLREFSDASRPKPRRGDVTR
jgi:phosphate transport system protein